MTHLRIHWPLSAKPFNFGYRCYTLYIYIYRTCVYIYIYIYIYRVSQEECARLRESVPYIKVYRYNPKHLYPKFNRYGDNGQRKMWSSCGSTYCTCPADQSAGQVQYAFSQRRALLIQLCSRLIPKFAVSKR